MSQSRSTRYKVWSRSPRYFDTIDAANAYAAKYFRRRGVIVAISATRKVRK